MPPRKSTQKTSSPVKNKQGKVPKVREKKQKLNQKTPSIMKVKLPSMKSLLAGNLDEDTMSPMKPLTAAERKMNLANERKIELANEVALAQLKPAAPKIDAPILETKSVKAKKKKTCRKKGTKVPLPIKLEPEETLNNPTDASLPNAIQTTSSPASNVSSGIQRFKRGRTRKVAESVENSTTETIAEVVNEPKKKTVRNTTIIVEKEDDINTLNAPNQRKADSTTTKKPAASKRTKSITIVTPTPETPFKGSTTPKQIRSYRRKGKKILEDVSSDNQNSPSILDPEIKMAKEENEDASKAANVIVPYEKSELVNSRKTSTNSECPSWTKDISSSSTTTCLTVCSTDFVRFDKKYPIIKLSNIDSIIKKSTANTADEHLLSGSSETNEKSTKCTSESSWSSDDSSASGPNLSSPSISTKSPSTSVNNFNPSLSSPTKNNVSKMEYVSDKLSSKLKKLDLEIMNWIGYGNEDLPKPSVEFQEKIFNVLKEESEIIYYCRKIKSLFADDMDILENNDAVVDDCPNVNSNKTNDIAKPASDYGIFTDISDDDDNLFTSSASKHKMLDQKRDESPQKDPPEKPCTDTYEEDFASNQVKHTSFDPSYDDDDALSLFAESITGLESTKFSSTPTRCVGSHLEEYIPQPISNSQFNEGVSYNPTKITNDDIGMTNKTKTICKKQFADSTYREFELNNKSMDNDTNVSDEHVYDTTPDPPMCSPPPQTLNAKKHTLMSSLHHTTSAVKSIVFKGVCFFNLISNCKKARCLFPHMNLDINDVKNRLARLSDTLFISEYMLMRSWPGLRRLYGICFVEECCKRELKRILVEMAIDFIQKANVSCHEDALLKVEVNELVLTHLNKVSLNLCEDLLLYHVEPNKSLCDVLMQTIAETQNFSRFKLVFIYLTNFIVENGGSFTLDVASQILERVCILPSEAPLALALMTIMQNTDPAIYGNSMTRQLEKQLSSLDCDLYEKFLSLKEQAFANQPGLDNVNQEQDKISLAQSDGERYTSPDTTKLENMNKSVEEPIITRNLDMIRQLSINNIQKNVQSNRQDYGPPAKKAKFRQYRGNMNNNLSPRNRYQPRPVRPLMHPLNQVRMNQRHMVYGQFPKFPRRPGPSPGF